MTHTAYIRDVKLSLVRGPDPDYLISRGPDKYNNDRKKHLMLRKTTFISFFGVTTTSFYSVAINCTENIAYEY